MEKKTKKSNRVIWIAIALVLVISVLAVTGNIPFIKGKEAGKSFNLKGKETRPVLDPAIFTGKTFAAYTAAKKYPEIMNEVYCYCYCNEPPFHHKSLLSCFVDEHGAA